MKKITGFLSHLVLKSFKKNVIKQTDLLLNWLIIKHKKKLLNANLNVITFSMPGRRNYYTRKLRLCNLNEMTLNVVDYRFSQLIVGTTEKKAV